ncbi:MAG: PAS domain S-box protein, partial [Desulfobacterales bacterium]|nr:PAS domain S-box protein [Desulfobacterales bacterium]
MRESIRETSRVIEKRNFRLGSVIRGAVRALGLALGLALLLSQPPRSRASDARPKNAPETIMDLGAEVPGVCLHPGDDLSSGAPAAFRGIRSFGAAIPEERSLFNGVLEPAARMAPRVSKEEAVASPPVARAGPNGARRHDARSPRPGARITDPPGERVVINKPDSIYTARGAMIRVGVAGLALVIILMIALMSNIVKRKRAEQALKEQRERLDELVEKRTRVLGKNEKLLSTVIDATRDAMISINEEGVIILFNPAAEKMFGRTKKEMMGRPLDRLMPEEYRKAHSANIRGYFKTGLPNRAMGRVVELPGVRSNGERFPMNVSLSEGKFNHERFVIAIARDISDWKKTEESLRFEIDQREQAEEQLRVLVEDLERTNTELQDFAYIVSHDLKAPLRGVISLANWLKEDHGEALDENGREYIRKLIARTKRMHNLIEGILQYSRAGRAQTTPEPVSSRGVVRDVVASLAPHETTPVTILDSLPTIVYDKLQLRQLFQNLIGNAIEHMG